MMLNKLMILALFLVAVHGTQQGKANKLRKQREKRRKASRSLRENERKLDEIGAPPHDQDECTAMVPSTVEKGIVVFLQLEGEGEGEGAVALEVPQDATVATLVAVADASGVDLSSRTLRFGGELLSDNSAPLADIGVCAEGVISVSPFVWNRETLHALQPIFEAQVVVEGGENKIVFLQWDQRSTRDLEEAGGIRMQLLFSLSDGQWSVNRYAWSEDQRDVMRYLVGAVIVGECLHNIKFIEVDVSDHISVTDPGNGIDLPCPIPERDPFLISSWWSVVLRRVAHVAP